MGVALDTKCPCVKVSMCNSQTDAGHQLHKLYQNMLHLQTVQDSASSSTYTEIRQVYHGSQHKAYTNVRELLTNIDDIFANAHDTFTKFHKVFL